MNDYIYFRQLFEYKLGDYQNINLRQNQNYFKNKRKILQKVMKLFKNILPLSEKSATSFESASVEEGAYEKAPRLQTQSP